MSTPAYSRKCSQLRRNLRTSHRDTQQRGVLSRAPARPLVWSSRQVCRELATSLPGTQVPRAHLAPGATCRRPTGTRQLSRAGTGGRIQCRLVGDNRTVPGGAGRFVLLPAFSCGRRIRVNCQHQRNEILMPENRPMGPVPPRVGPEWFRAPSLKTTTFQEPSCKYGSFPHQGQTGRSLPNFVKLPEDITTNNFKRRTVIPDCLLEDTNSIARSHVAECTPAGPRWSLPITP